MSLAIKELKADSTILPGIKLELKWYDYKDGIALPLKFGAQSIGTSTDSIRRGVAAVVHASSFKVSSSIVICPKARII